MQQEVNFAPGRTGQFSIEEWSRVDGQDTFTIAHEYHFAIK